MDSAGMAAVKVGAPEAGSANQNKIAWFDISTAELFNEIGAMRPERFDELPFGAIALSADGKVVSYNAAEAAFANKTATNVIGRDFFRDVAPCARVRSFSGVIESAAPGSGIDSSFLFTFRFVQGWRQARIRILRQAGEGVYTFIFVSPDHSVIRSKSQSSGRGSARAVA